MIASCVCVPPFSHARDASAIPRPLPSFQTERRNTRCSSSGSKTDATLRAGPSAAPNIRRTATGASASGDRTSSASKIHAPAIWIPLHRFCCPVLACFLAVRTKQMMAEITNSSSPRRIGIDSRKPTSVIPKAALARVPLSHHPAFYGHALSIAPPSVKICENGPRRTSRQTHERPG